MITSKYIRLLLLKSKDEYLSAFKKFKAVVEKGNHQIHRVRGDAELHQSTEAQDFFNECSFNRLLPINETWSSRKRLLGRPASPHRTHARKRSDKKDL
jgi:hypothetical protein